MEASQNGSASDYGRTAPMWSSNVDMQRGSSRSPSEMQKMKSCHNAQCGVYDGMSVPIANGHCQQSSHGRLYPAAYLPSQQQQHPMGVRSVPQQHHHQYHHPSSIQPCHPHPAQSYASVATSGPVPHPAHPHMDRMMHGPSSVAASPQMRSIVMNHYPATASYPYPHNSSMSSSGYYSQAVGNASVSGNGPCMDYSHLSHGVPGNGAAQYAPQHQRAINAVPTSSANSYRPMQNLGAHSHSKVMNPSQAAMYQNAYHQYAQYFQQQQGLVHPHQAQHHPNGPTTAALNMASHHHQQQQAHQQVQQTRLLQYMSRGGQPPSVTHHHHNHVYSTPCHSHMMSNCSTQPQPQAHPQPNVGETVSGHSTNSEVSSNSKEGPAPDGNCKPSTSETTEEVKEKQPSTETDICKEMSCCPKTPLVKIASVKLKCKSPAESIKIKATKSATRLRDRQPKLMLGRKKKSTGTGSSSIVSGGKKLKSYLKVSSSSTETGCEFPSLLEKKPNSTQQNPIIECVHAEPLCNKPRPPPGFEHLIPPAFPIEMCDRTLLGNFIGGELSSPKGLSSESVQQCFGEELDDLIAVLPCCDKEGVDVDWESEKPLGMGQEDDLLVDDWETLNKAIRSAVDEWTEELNLLGRFQIILQDDLSLKSINLFKNF